MFFHVSSVRNRESIEQHGLDWDRMGAARGIAGSHSFEVEGIFLARDEEESDYFVRMNNTGGRVDVWTADGVDPSELVDNGSGYDYVPRRIPRADLTLVRRDVEMPDGRSTQW